MSSSEKSGLLGSSESKAGGAGDKSSGAVKAARVDQNFERGEFCILAKDLKYMDYPPVWVVDQTLPVMKVHALELGSKPLPLSIAGEDAEVRWQVLHPDSKEVNHLEYRRAPMLETRHQSLHDGPNRPLLPLEQTLVQERLDKAISRSWYDGDRKAKLLGIQAKGEKIKGELSDVLHKIETLRLTIELMKRDPATDSEADRRVAAGQKGMSADLAAEVNKKNVSRASGQMVEAIRRRLRDNEVFVSTPGDQLERWKAERSLKMMSNYAGSDMSSRHKNFDYHVDVICGDEMVRQELTDSMTFEELLDYILSYWNLPADKFVLVANAAPMAGDWKGVRFLPSKLALDNLIKLGEDHTQGCGNFNEELPEGKLPHLYLIHEDTVDVADSLRRNPAKFRKFYDAFDVDASESFDFLELRDFLTKYFRGKYVIRKDLAFQIYEKYRSSKSGGMTFNDLKQCLYDWEIIIDEDMQSRVSLTAEDVFKEIESDSNDQVYMEDFVRAVHVLNERYPEPLARSLFNKIDEDKSKSISWQEFKASWSHLKEEVFAYDKATADAKKGETLGEVFRSELNIAVPTTKNYSRIPAHTMAAIREGLFFALIMVLFVLALFQRRSIKQQNDAITAVHRNLVEMPFGDKGYEFKDVHDESRMWQWMEHILMPQLLKKTGPNGEPRTSEQLTYMYEYNKHVPIRFSLRMRQQRGNVQRDTACQVGPLPAQCTLTAEKKKKECRQCERFEKYQESNHQKSPELPSRQNLARECEDAANILQLYGTGTDQQNIPTAFVYNSSEALHPSMSEETFWMDGKLSSYDGSGYSYDIMGPIYVDRNTAENQAKFKKDLFEREKMFRTMVKCLSQSVPPEAQSWIDRSTRAIQISFLLYNQNYNFYVQPRFLFEFSPTGMVVPTAVIDGLEIDVYESNYQMGALIMEWVVVGLSFLWLLYKIRGFMEFKSAFRTTWDAFIKFMDAAFIMDLILIGILVAGRAVQLRYWSAPHRQAIYLTEGPPRSHENWTNLISLYHQAFIFDSIAVLLLSFKLMRYGHVNYTTSQLLQVIHKAIPLMAYFTFIFIGFFYAYAILAHNIFGPRVEAFCEFSRAVITLLKLICGTLIYQPLYESNKFWAPVFAVIFILQMTMIFGKLYLVILNMEYTKTLRRNRVFDQRDRRKWPMSEYCGILIPRCRKPILDQDRLDTQEYLAKQRELVDGKKARRKEREAELRAKDGAEGKAGVEMVMMMDEDMDRGY